MTVEIRAKLICDACGTTIDGRVGRMSTLLWESYVDARTKAKVARWVTARRYGKAKHYCQPCADGVPNNGLSGK